MCDLTEPTCKKCEKKGLECPGYGIRYRFTGGQTVSSSEIGPGDGSTATLSKRRRSDLKWVGVSKPTKRKRAAECLDLGPGARPSSNFASKGVGSTEAVQVTEATVAESGEEVNRRVVSDDQGLVEADLVVAHSEGSDISLQSSADSNGSWILPDDSSLIEFNRNSHFSGSTITFNLPPLLSHPNAMMRLLFHHCKSSHTSISPHHKC